MKNIEQTNRNLKIRTIFVVIISSLAGCLYGLDLGAIGGALGFMTKEMNLTPVQQGMIVGAVLGGGSIAILITGVLVDIFGRKKMIIISAAIFLVGVFWTSYASDYNSLLWGRVVMGTGIGISAILVPLYLSEIMPANIRGRAVTCFQLFLTGGILLAFLVDLAFAKSGNWRAMFEVLAIPGFILFIASFFLPESPVWYFMKNRLHDTKKSLSKLYTLEEAESRISEMEKLATEKRQDKNQTVFKKAYIIPFAIALAIACLTQTTGIDSIIPYAPIILADTGEKSAILTVLFGTGVSFINFVATIIAMMFIDKIGRKPLLVFSTGTVSIFLLLSGLASLLPNSQLKVILLVIGIFGYIFCFGIGIGVVVWLAMSELLPTAIRAKGLAICLFANSMLSTIIAAVFVIAKVRIGYSGVFFIFAGFTIIFFILSLFTPETKGKTIEQIEEYFRKAKKA